ncbi:hypothetical protein HRR78_002939 [Exophiala dermatitidis]|nr:hypothetical protein HRR75_004859 [Exophiala dermatitidis]KAJ4554535.1 hypothetical protein HRR78_002939 [Exophiala dermatitidis]KAJ4577690.1 hypothetical protein HRR79_001026 [Exophiala dermatitidis]KAJ4585847.1 hypothetical protein HRR82_002900 [Exophiala dermatitidis]KAJ4613024.1 hypothetical protein HRR85_004587 [Exophiala dermatitidis]
MSAETGTGAGVSARTISDYSHDHVILLLDTPDFENPPAWLSDNFQIIEGGVHAGGSSRNKLIVFSDGTYIELINWIAEPTEFFDWKGKPAGLIDFALTTPAPKSAQETIAEVDKRLTSPGTSGDSGLGIQFKQPIHGGRKRKDGKKVEWYVTKPSFDNSAPSVPRPLDQYFPTGRLDVPFFCHDVTDRLLRIPYKDSQESSSYSSLTTHPCGARGILSVDVVVPEEQFENYVKLYTAVSGALPQRISSTSSSGEDSSGVTASNRKNAAVFFPLSAPDQNAMKDVEGKVGIELRTPRDEADDAWIQSRGVGIRQVRLYAPSAAATTTSTSTTTPHQPGRGKPLASQGIGESLLLVQSV